MAQNIAKRQQNTTVQSAGTGEDRPHPINSPGYDIKPSDGKALVMQ